MKCTPWYGIFTTGAIRELRRQAELVHEIKYRCKLLGLDSDRYEAEARKLALTTPRSFREACEIVLRRLPLDACP